MLVILKLSWQKSRAIATLDLITNDHLNDQLTLAVAVNNLNERQYWRWSDVNGFVANDENSSS